MGPHKVSLIMICFDKEGFSTLSGNTDPIARRPPTRPASPCLSRGGASH